MLRKWDWKNQWHLEYNFMANKQKGSAFEREICKKLSTWWAGRDDVFWRSSNSGGRATIRKKQGKGTYGQYGDIACTDPIGHPFLKVFTVELKRGYSKCSVADLIDSMPKSAPSQFAKFVSQAKEEAKNAGSYFWLLIVKRDRKREIIYMPVDAVRLFGFRKIIFWISWKGEKICAVSLSALLKKKKAKQRIENFAWNLAKLRSRAVKDCLTP